MNQEIIPHNTILQMVDTWQTCQIKIYKAFELLEESEKFLKIVFDQHIRLNLRQYHDINRDGAAYIIKNIKKDAWRAIVNKTEIKRFLSIKREREIESKFNADDLPDLTEEEILKLLRSACANIQNFADEMVIEVYEMLRPHSGYKTNEKFAYEVGKRVVLNYKVEQKYNSTKFRVIFNRESEIRALDNIFHALDGKGFSATYHGELNDAIEASENGVGETEYFKFKCYKNKNLHIEFKRLDLVKKINAIASKNILKPNI